MNSEENRSFDEVFSDEERLNAAMQRAADRARKLAVAFDAPIPVSDEDGNIVYIDPKTGEPRTDAA